MPSIPQHTAQGITAVNDGVGRQIHRDAQFLIVSSPNQNALLRLPSGPGNSWEGQEIEGYVGANGFTLTGATSINGATTYQVPPNYYFSVLKGIGSLWIIEIVDNLGTGGGGDIENYNLTTMANWVALREAARAGTGGGRVVCVGNSKTFGVPGFRVNSWPSVSATVLAASGVPITAKAMVGAGDKTTTAEIAAYDPQLTFGAGWEVYTTAPSLGGRNYLAPSVGDVTTPLTVAPAVMCDRLRIHYLGGANGSFTYSINGGADSAPVSTASASGTLGAMVIDLPRAVNNVVTFKRITGTANVFFALFAPYDSTASLIEFYNAGWGASVSTDWANDTQARSSLSVLKTLAPKLTIVAAPTNDYTPSYGPIPLATFEANIRKIVAAAKLSGDCALIAEAPSAPARQTQAIQDQYNSVLRTIALDSGCSFFDFVKKMGGYDAGVAAGYYTDQTHLTQSGYAFQGNWIGNRLAT